MATRKNWGGPRRSNRGRSKRSAFTRKGKVAKISRPLKNAIKRVVAGTQETKYRAEALRCPNGLSTLNEMTVFTSGITGTGEIYSLLPQLNEGNASWERNGTTVFPKKLRVKINLVSTQTNLKNSDYMVYAFFLESTSVKAIANYTAIPITQLLEDGAGAHSQFDGTALTSLYKIDNNTFKVIKVIKKRMIYNVPIGPLAGAAAVAQDHTTNHHSMTLDIPVPKRLLYPTETATYPTNFAPFMVLGFIDNTYYGDNAPGATEFVYVEGRSELWYKDS